MPPLRRCSPVARSAITHSRAPTSSPFPASYLGPTVATISQSTTPLSHARSVLLHVSARRCRPLGPVSAPGRALPSFVRAQTRGKRTRTTVNLDDLPQGRVESAGPPPADEVGSGPAYPTVVLQARRNMQKFDNCVLLTRVGGFYELYFEQAEEYGPLLNLKVAQKKTNAGPVPMAGFPFFQLDRFLKLLVQDLNRYVAIAEEFPNDPAQRLRSGGLMHDRRVTRIITPGTLIDENFMDPYVNNYVMSIHLCGTDSASPAPGPSVATGRTDDTRLVLDGPASASIPLGLSWLDLSTGCFFTQSTTLLSLPSILARLAPREVVLDESLESRRGHSLFSVLAEDRHLVTYAREDQLRTPQDWAPMLESEIPPETAAAFTEGEVRAASLLLHYVEDRLRGLSLKLQPPMRHESRQVMAIDKNSMRSLEIKQTIRDGAFRGSLLHAIRRTVTRSGARLLNEWISSPSTSLGVIKSRHDLVSRFIRDEDLRDGIVLLLRKTHDSQRLVQRFALNRGDHDDLLRLASTIKATEDVVQLIRSRVGSSAHGSGGEDDCLDTLLRRISLEGPIKLYSRIHEAIDEEGLVRRHQVEDSEAGEMMALAQEILDTEGKGGEGDSTVAIPKTAKKKAKSPSLREHYGEDNDVWIMKPDASPGLRHLHAELTALLQERVTLTETLRAQFGASSLTLRWTPGLGHICHLKGKDARAGSGSSTSTRRNRSSADASVGAVDDVSTLRTISSSRTTRSFHHPDWTALGGKLDKVRYQIRQEEQRVFASLREAVVLNLVKLRRNAAVLDELDITTSFARLAIEQNLTRPTVVDVPPSSGVNVSASSSSSSPGPTTVDRTPETIIIGGRHPTVEGGLAAQGRTFTPNNLIIGGASPSHGRVWLITGPNMAGKSTFLRQNALITILAQAGCFVPAAHATVGLVDALFSRVGSADNLYADQSTFMVEMLETAAILRQATARSFVVMDEIGRGTTPEDGAAVAFAALDHLVRVSRCRALFATHFHAVADLAARKGLRLVDGGDHGAVEMYCTDVEEDEGTGGGFVYVHKLRKGVNRRSHALKVARLAGLPEPAIQVAEEVLRGFGKADNGNNSHYEGNLDITGKPDKKAEGRM